MLPADSRLRRRTDFVRALRRGPANARAARATLVLTVTVPPHAPDAAGGALVGFAVSRAVGSAVVRNTVRRRLRHLMVTRLDSLPPGALVVVRALPTAALVSSATLGRDLDSALDAGLARLRVGSAGARG